MVGEADIYIAYGRFPQAISFLRNALEAEPDRQDIRLKLMEVFVETRDVDAFNAEGAILAAAGTEEELYRARQLQAKLPGANAIVAPEEADEYDLDATLIDTSMNVSAIAQAARGPSLDLDLNLEDTDEMTADGGEAPPLDIDLNLADQESAAAQTGSGVDFELDVDLDTDLDTDLAEPGRVDEIDLDDVFAEAADKRDADDGELGGDLGFDFDDESDAADAAKDAAGADSGAVADLDDALGDLDLSDEDSFVEMESTIEKSIEKQLAESAEHDDPFDLDRPEPSEAIDPGGADDTSGLDLTIDGRAEPVEPVTARDGGFDIDDLDPDSDDGLSLTLDGRDDLRPETADDDFNLDELDLDDAGLDETIAVDSGDERLDDTITMGDDDRRAESSGRAEEDDLSRDFDLGDDADEGAAKLELAQALIDAGDADGAREVLSELIEDGDERERNAARELLGKLG